MYRRVEEQVNDMEAIAGRLRKTYVEMSDEGFAALTEELNHFFDVLKWTELNPLVRAARDDRLLYQRVNVAILLEFSRQTFAVGYM